MSKILYRLGHWSVRRRRRVLAGGPEVEAVTDPFATGTVSPEGTIAFADVQFATPSTEVSEEAVDALYGAAGPAEAAGVRVEFGGEVGRPEELGHSRGRPVRHHVGGRLTDLSSTAPILATMIGLAVGIDYALFIVTRHRQNLAEGHDVEESAARATATAGGAVVFAGLTVVIALAGLGVMVLLAVPLFSMCWA